MLVFTPAINAMHPSRWPSQPTAFCASTGEQKGFVSLLRKWVPKVGIAFAAGFFCTGATYAQDATWNPTANMADFNTATNWVPAAVPARTAIFDASPFTAVTSSSNIFVGGLQFNTGAPAYFFDLQGKNLTIQNLGMVNNSSNQQTFTFNSGFIQFSSGTAANVAIVTGVNGTADFENGSTAGSSTISNSGLTEFLNTATAGNATITNNSGALTKFAGTSTGGGARFINNVGGTVDISQLTSTGTTAGSIEGGGTFALGSKALTVGSNNLNTTVSGTLVDGGIGGGTGGSLIKVGNGTLALSGINTYSGGTTVAGGVLSVNRDAALGNAAGGVTLQGGELLTTAVFSSARPVTLNPIGIANTLAAGIGTTVTYTGTISGNGALTIGDGTNTGTVFLASGVANTYTGGTTVIGGATLTVNTDQDLGGSSGNITLNGGKLATIGFTTGRTVNLLGPGILAARNTSLNWSAAFNGQITGPGALTVGDANSSTLTVALTNPGNNYAGGTTVTGGATLQINNDLELGTGGLTLNGGSLQTTLDGFTSARAITLIPALALANTLSPLSNTTATYTGLISGSGSLTTNGLGGTVVLTGPNTYSGGTTIRNGVLSVATDGNLGNAIGAITLEQGTLLTTVNGFTSSRSILLLTGEGNDTLAALSGTTAIYAGPISGAGSLFVGDFNFQSGTPHGGTVVFTNHSNSYTSGTTITNGAILSVDSNSELGAPSGGLTINDGELLTTGNGFASARTIALQGTFLNALAAATGTTATYSGVISGSRLLTIGDFVNGGTVVLSGVNSYTGGTEIRGVVAQGSDIPSGGTLVAASDGALGAGPVGISRGILIIPRGVTIGNPIRLVEGGIVDNAGTLNSDITDSFSVAEVVINSGTINGRVTLGGAHDIVQLFTGSKMTGNLDLGSTTNSQLILDGAGNQLLSQAVLGTITDHGTLIKQGSGAWTIDEALSAPLGTEILGGTLIVGSPLTTAQVNITPGATLQLNTGGSVGNLIDDGSLIFAGSDTVNFATVINGRGTVIQAGPGTTILSGRNTYSGGTLINLGTLLVNNPQALGTGNVVVNGGVLAADPQPINVLGNYTQNAGGTLRLNIAGRAPGQFDVLNVAGTASLNGNLRLINLGYAPQNGDKLRLINAGGVVSGRFSALQNPFAVTPGFDTIDLVYARNSVTLEFLKLNTPVIPIPPNPPGPPAPPIIIMSTDYASFALTPNQLAVGNALNRLQLTRNDPRLVDFLAGEPSLNLPGDLEKISPDSLAALYEISFSAANVQASNLEARFAEIRNGSSGFSSSLNLKNTPRTIVEGKDGKAILEPDPGVMMPGSGNRWGVWISGSGDYVDVSSDGNGKGFDFTTGGVTLGLDYRLTQNLAVGVALGYAHTWSNLNGGGDLSANSGKAGLYATYYQNGFFVNGYVGGGYNSYDTKRDTLGGATSGSPDSGEFDGYLGGGYEFHRSGFTFGPIAALQYTYVGIGGNTEIGSLAPLQISSQHADSFRTNLGLKASYAARVGTIEVTPSVSASWQHEFLYSALPITAQFVGSGNRFTVAGPEEGQDSALINAGVNLQWTPKIGTYLGYNGQLGRSRYDSQGGVCSVHIDF